jgi:tRNA modification GTPase
MRDTICAIATAPGSGGIGVVRVSGEQASAIAGLFLGKAARPRYAHFSRFLDANGVEIDHGLLIFFPAPNSFTGEDVVELQAHGSPIALSMLMQRCLELGARAARAGEFSERAFLNHKLDLTQAEAIADLIAAQSEAAARAAVRSLDGDFSKRVHSVLKELTELRKYIEAMIDFPDEEIDFSHNVEVMQRQQRLLTSLVNLQTAARAGQRLRDGIYVVIVGPPNAGKSSLLNVLAKTEAAIVTPIAGTTRDVLREHIVIDGIPVTMVDTAGLRESTDLVESEGIRRAHAELMRADLILLLIGADQSLSFAQLQQSLPADVQDRPMLKVRNKSDLASTPSAEKAIEISTQNGNQLIHLQQLILQAAGVQKRESVEGGFSARARHVHALQQVLEHLQTAGSWFQSAQGELAAEELRLAQLALSSITGEFTADDLLGQIFSSFCIGK